MTSIIPVVNGELWQSMSALSPEERPTIRLDLRGVENGEVRRRLIAAMLADPGLMSVAVGKPR